MTAPTPAGPAPAATGATPPQDGTLVPAAAEPRPVDVAVHVRYFAGAAEAAGIPAEDVVLPAGATGDDLVAAMTAGRGPRLQRVLAISSLLVDDVVREDLTQPLRPTAAPSAAVRVDVLPPFAGG